MDSKRPFWQIHLSTAVVMMFASALFMLANAYRHMEQGPPGWFGWPYSILRDSSGGWDAFHPHEPVWDVSYAGLFLNVSFMVWLVVAVGMVCEWFIHRRANSQSSSETTRR